MSDDLVKRLRADVEEFDGCCGADATEAADRIEELEIALREKDNIAFIIDSHGITHRTFTIIYTGEKTK